MGDDGIAGFINTIVILSVLGGVGYIAYTQINKPPAGGGNGNGNGNGGGNGSGNGGGGGGGVGGKIGPDGVREIYPTASGSPFVWYMNANNPTDGYLNFGGGSNFSKLLKNPDGSWRANDNVDVKFNIIVNKGEAGGKPDAIKGCAMNFADCVTRGYAHAPNDVGKKGVEMTGFFKVYGPLGHNSHDSIPGVFMKGPWSHHPGTAGECCQEVEYYHVIGTDGAIHYVKEGSRNDIYPDPRGAQKIPSFNMIGSEFFGLKYVLLNETVNKADPKVRIQTWFNRNGDGLSWIKVGETVDNATAKWGPTGIRCGGKEYQVYAWANSGMVIKFYTSRVDFKKWSIRDIAPVSSAYTNVYSYPAKVIFA